MSVGQLESIMDSVHPADACWTLSACLSLALVPSEPLDLCLCNLVSISPVARLPYSLCWHSGLD